MTELSPTHHAALRLLADWMSSRYYRTFRLAEESAEPFDAILHQRERRIGVTVGLLWDDSERLAGADDYAELLTADIDSDEAIEEGGYAVWVPPGAELPTEEPARSNLRVILANGFTGLGPGERREVRIPVTLKLAQVMADGAYVSVSGGLSTQWTSISEGVTGAYHLDARALHRLPDEQAETDIIVSRVRDKAALLNPEEVTDVPVHDYWRVSRLPQGAEPGAAMIGAPPSFDPQDGALARRYFRQHVNRAVEQRRAGESDLSVLVLVGALAHIEDELVTAALRGMNPATYGALDLIALVADASVRQVLQPRSLPWEAQR